MEEVDKSNKKLGMVREKIDSEQENSQELVPIEVSPHDLEDGKINNKSARNNLPSSSKFSKTMKETLAF